MKILHALVGYLTVTALPFSPFALAHPLAPSIDYDGSVNSSPNHIDSTLMKRVTGDIIEARQAELEAIDIALIITAIAAVIINLKWLIDENSKRKAFTQNTISKMITQYPKFNWVICHSPYSAAFDGVEGTDWGYTHHELPVSLDRTIGYDLYWAKSGTFYRYGDGGFINWAYNGNILGTDNGGGTVHFGTIS